MMKQICKKYKSRYPLNIKPRDNIKIKEFLQTAALFSCYLQVNAHCLFWCINLTVLTLLVCKLKLSYHTYSHCTTYLKQVLSTVIQTLEEMFSLPHTFSSMCCNNRVDRLTATAALDADLRTLFGGNDPLRLPRPRGSDRVQLVLQQRSGFSDSREASFRNRVRRQQKPADRSYQTTGGFSERHVGKISFWIVNQHDWVIT